VWVGWGVGGLTRAKPGNCTIVSNKLFGTFCTAAGEATPEKLQESGKHFLGGTEITDCSTTLSIAAAT
jgi:hypothetical protein